MKSRRKALVLAVLAVGTMLAVQAANATHPRPRGASPIRVSLVPAYDPCTAPNRTHGPPLAFPSCSPPVQSSDFLTVGTPDANGAPANSIGSVRINVYPGTPGAPDDSYVQLSGNITDVRCKTGVSACSNSNAQGGPDYTGELQGNATIRIIDHWNATSPGGGTDPATMVDIPMPFHLSCFATADTSIGSTCVFPVPSTECLGCPTPKEGRRTVVQITQFVVRDGGPDGQVYTDDNTLFMVQGIFVP